MTGKEETECLGAFPQSGKEESDAASGENSIANSRCIQEAITTEISNLLSPKAEADRHGEKENENILNMVSNDDYDDCKDHPVGSEDYNIPSLDRKEQRRYSSAVSLDEANEEAPPSRNLNNDDEENIGCAQRCSSMVKNIDSLERRDCRGHYEKLTKPGATNPPDEIGQFQQSVLQRPTNRQPGRGFPGRGPGRGRGLSKGSTSGQSSTDSSDFNRRRMIRAATGSFSYRPNPVECDLLKPQLGQKSASYNNLDESKAKQDPHLTSGSARRLGPFAYGISKEQAHYPPKIIRESNRIDIKTGGETHREVTCQRIIDNTLAMDPRERRRKMLVRRGNDRVMNTGSLHRDHNDPQYRIQSKSHSHAFNEQIGAELVNPGALTRYLIWSLRSNFIIVLLSEALAFWTLICIFATCVYTGSHYEPDCIQLPDGKNFEEGGGFFLDAFAVSWTTFTTVGYGMVHPQVHKEFVTADFSCAFMTTLLSLESFVGVLFASFCGAVIVGKVTRAKSTANVKFSRRLVVRFGSGVMYTDEDDDRCHDMDERSISECEKNRKRFPCPVLEFRLSNTLFGNAHGEIMNSKLSIVGSTLVEDGEEHPKTSNDPDGNGKKTKLPKVKGIAGHASSFLRKRLIRSMHDSGDGRSSVGNRRNVSFATTSTNSEADKKCEKEKKNTTFKKLSMERFKVIESVLIRHKMTRARDSKEDTEEAKKSPKHKRSVFVDEDPTGGLIPKRMFTTLDTECNTHPFFKRVWTIRHVLNADSPLLSSKARKMIRAKGGLWPLEACNYEFIRNHVHFQQLIVSLSGTTGLNHCNAYGLHVYEYRDLHVGYAFAPILEAQSDGTLKVDLERIDNIREQRGGGSEPIDYYAEKLAGTVSIGREDLHDGINDPNSG